MWWADLQGSGALEGFRWAPPEERHAFRERLFALRDVHGGRAFRWGMQMWWEGGPLPSFRSNSWRPLRLTLGDSGAGRGQLPGWLTGRLLHYLQGKTSCWEQPVFPSSGASYGAPLAALMGPDPQEGRLQSWLKNFVPRLSIRAEPTPSYRPRLHGDGCDFSGLGMRAPWAALELAVNTAHLLPADTSDSEGQQALDRFEEVHTHHVLREWEGPLRGEDPAELFRQWALEAFPLALNRWNQSWQEVRPRFLRGDPSEPPVGSCPDPSILRYLILSESRAL
jgi:hypothetical protein